MLGVHSLQGPRIQYTGRTLSGTASTAIGTVDPTTAGELITAVVVNVKDKIEEIKLSSPTIIRVSPANLWHLVVENIK